MFFDQKINRIVLFMICVAYISADYISRAF